MCPRIFVGTNELSTRGREVETSGEPGESRIRRRWPVQEKLKILLETLEPGVNANQLFICRSQYRRGEFGAACESDRGVKLLPVQVEQAIAPQPASSVEGESPSAPAECMEILISGSVT